MHDAEEAAWLRAVSVGLVSEPRGSVGRSGILAGPACEALSLLTGRIQQRMPWAHLWMDKFQMGHQGRHSHAAVAAEDHSLHAHVIRLNEAVTDGGLAVLMTWQTN